MVAPSSDGAPGGPRYLTRSEVARLLGVSPTTVTRWAREGRLPYRKTLGGHHRFDPREIARVRDGMHARDRTARPPEEESDDESR